MEIGNEELSKRFEELFSEWQRVIRDPKIQVSSRPQDYIDNEPYRKIVGLGEKALPLVLDKLQQGVFLLNQAVLDITGKNADEIFGKERILMSEQEKSRLLVDWWRTQKQ